MQLPTTTVTIDIPFHDVDILGVVWHGHYYKYFELARTALFRERRLDIHVMKELGYYMVVADSACRYIHALKYGMCVTVRVTLVEWEFRLKLAYLITDADGRKLARGTTTQVTIDAETHGLRLNTPTEFIDRLLQQPAKETAHGRP